MKRLYRSKSDRKIAGILGGLGELYDIDPNLLRLLTVLGFLVSGFFPVLFTYIVAWILLPDGKPEEPQRSRDNQTVPARKPAGQKRGSTSKPVKK